MKTVRLLVALTLVALMLLAAAAPAGATTSAADCQAKIAALRTATLGATFTGQNAAKDQAGLVGKLDSAAAKLDQGKVADALQALTQFRNRVIDLDAQAKIRHDDAITLLAGADDAIACVQNLSSST